jgi:hypothetical protein
LIDRSSCHEPRHDAGMTWAASGRVLIASHGRGASALRHARSVAGKRPPVAIDQYRRGPAQRSAPVDRP